MSYDDPAESPGPTAPSTSPVSRFAWQSGGLVVGRGAALVALILMARDLGLERYGKFVVLLAMFELAAAPWKPTVQQGAAARIGRGASHSSWVRTITFWWVVGSVVLGPIAVLFADVWAALALIVASGANAWMIEHVPALLLGGRQRKIALATTANQLVRLVLVVILIAAGALTPTLGLAAIAGGFLVGGFLMREPAAGGSESTGLLLAEVGADALRWVEAHGPVLIVALILGLDTAGGFDLLFKLAMAVGDILAGVGLIVLPGLVGAGAAIGRYIARGVRLPTVLAFGLAALYAAGVVPVLEMLTDAHLDLGSAPLLLSVILVLAPWMGVSKAGLVVVGGSGWLLPSQLATASATIVAAVVASQGVVWAAAAVALAQLAAAVIRGFGMNAHRALPTWRETVSIAGLRDDLTAVRRLRVAEPS